MAFLLFEFKAVGDNDYGIVTSTDLDEDLVRKVITDAYNSLDMMETVNADEESD